MLTKYPTSTYFELCPLLQDACVEKIARFIGGDGLGMVDRHYGYGRQNTYQRTLSQDSTANSTRSDETFTVNGKEQ